MTTSEETTKLQIELMAREASRRLAAADFLSTTTGDFGDSAYLLELLAFELLRKATLRIHVGTGEIGHNYRVLFSKLPAPQRARILAAATARVGPEVSYAEIEPLLAIWGANFVSLRYPYERYEGMDRAQYAAKGSEWIESGASVSTADFQYHPEQLFGLLCALEQEVSRWLART